MIIRKIGVLIFLSASLFVTAFAQTQAQLNQSACDELRQADTTLNKVYKDVLSAYSNDTDFIEHFITAQKKWIEFRDAYVASMYVPQNKDSYGSVLPMCQCYFLETITQDRIKQLRVWLDGVGEGDVCTGSVDPG